MLHEGQQVELAIEKPAAGGWMIARHHGEIVLVRGAIPGERVTAWVERAERRLAYAATRDILQASDDRRTPAFDPLCGGAVFAHIRYERQLQLKSEILQDAFARTARYPLPEAPTVLASPERHYRMRARLHVHQDRVGFYREGTHQLCDASPTEQLRPAAIEAVRDAAVLLHARAADAVDSISVTENLDGTELALHIDASGSARLGETDLDAVRQQTGARGVTAYLANGTAVSGGDPFVIDSLAAITGQASVAGTLRRSAASFFQGNRYLLQPLVQAVLQQTAADAHVVDLYAGAGLFAVALAATGHLEVTAVEGDRASGADLKENARPLAPALQVHVGRVEDYLASRRPSAGTILADPPRTGISKEAMQGILKQEPQRLVYVSCDPPTLARDARRLLDAGYTLTAIAGFDLFPNTAHVETLAVFSR